MHLVQHFEKIVLPAYTSFGHGQNFVQKGWDNGKFSHGPDDERIGSIIFLKGRLKSHSILLFILGGVGGDYLCDVCRKDY